MKNQRTNQEWQTLIRQYHSSGLSARAWCEKNSIPANTFYYHMRKLRKTTSRGTDVLSKPAKELQEIVPLRISDAPLAVPASETGSHTALPGILVHCKGLSVSIPDGASFGSICSVLKALHTLC